MANACIQLVSFQFLRSLVIERNSISHPRSVSWDRHVRMSLLLSHVPWQIATIGLREAAYVPFPDNILRTQYAI